MVYPAADVHRGQRVFWVSAFVRRYSTMLIEPQTPERAARLRRRRQVIVKELHDRRELMRLPERVIFNCTGLGARALFGDKKLGPVRGQLEILIPQPEVDYCYLSSGYMFPRHDGIVLGGTFDHDDWSLEPRADQRDWILRTHKEVMSGLKAGRAGARKHKTRRRPGNLIRESASRGSGRQRLPARNSDASQEFANANINHLCRR